MMNPRKRRRNSTSVVRETPVSRGQFLAQAFTLGSSNTAAYVFGSCVGRLFNFEFPNRTPRQNVPVGPGVDEARPDEANGQEGIVGEPVANIDGGREPVANIDGEREPVANIVGEPIANTDGEPIGNIDGEPVDDIDGEPFEDSSTDDE
ncbi:hypothetical protein TRIATDRAFT_300766 [Trichoderma atroviride IMI 206040]|uniref:Uncharacterized protein n=1 Tax=Hypocrea atroviridis (strain ATCC 20476 / IMI 206040) TaxID=452589 RepID=G9P255_HYPAI|nr:uncharacterized protein TRIATDRAFT_300766 [Trichoderma atroviride IMI 206040]EHK42650.1 hypothetical protein TRIATDRAFT_300766 [Trichoderma atroviride IMI 206040]